MPDAKDLSHFLSSFDIDTVSEETFRNLQRSILEGLEDEKSRQDIECFAKDLGDLQYTGHESTVPNTIVAFLYAMMTSPLPTPNIEAKDEDQHKDYHYSPLPSSPRKSGHHNEEYELNPTTLRSQDQASDESSPLLSDYDKPEA